MMSRPRWLLHVKDAPHRFIVYSLLVILIGTFGATSVNLPNNSISYLGFTAMLVAGGMALWREGWRPAGALTTLTAYDLIPAALVLVWMYGFALGLAHHNRTSGVIHNFAGMALYSLYYVFLFTRVRKFDLVRCLVAAAAINALYMFGFYLYDKGYGRLLAEPKFFRFFDVRAYYSETLVLLLAPIALLVRQILSPQNETDPRRLTRRDVWAILLLYAYIFAFLQISLSKATLLAYVAAIPVAAVALARRVIDLVRHRAIVRLAAVAGTVLVALYPLAILMAYISSPDRGSSPGADRSHLAPLFQRAEDRAAVEQFVSQAASRIGQEGRVFVPAGWEEIFQGPLGRRLVAESEWPTGNEMPRRGLASAPDTAALVRSLDIRYALVSTAQPRSQLSSLCVHSDPLLRSAALRPEPTSSLVFELYRLDDCRTAASPTAKPAAPDVSRFLADIALLVPDDAGILVRPEYAGTFASSVPGLVYRGAPGTESIRPSEWSGLMSQKRGEIEAALRRLGIAYVIVQTAQPRPAVLACAGPTPVVRSAPIVVGEQSQYAFALYALNRCHGERLTPAVPTAVVQAKMARREMNRAFLQDMHPLGKGLGAPLKGNLRDPDGYGFEQNYLNLAHKFGLFSLVIFAAYMVTIARIALGFSGFRTRHFSYASAAFLAGLIMGLGNPTLMSPVMVALHCMVMYWLRPS
ncbi:MAG: hypothetical protein ABJC51_04975, partial [Acidobacteriota bacterium]